VKYLLDTCTFLWWSVEDPNLSTAVREIVTDSDEEIFVSSISFAEIATKSSLGKLKLPGPLPEYIAAMRDEHLIESLPFDDESALHMVRLPWHHRDPFDRMLVAQAIVHGLVVLTPDRAITQYSARTLW
jgi:PIN domain nuclease of toxin-antitoxin system